MYFTTELNYDGKDYQLTFDEDSAGSPDWMELKSFLMPTINRANQLNRWFLDRHVNEVLGNWGKDHLSTFGPALRMMGATDADFVRLGLKFPAETIEPKKQHRKKKTSQV
jgi:hypothetical protein